MRSSLLGITTRNASQLVDDVVSREGARPAPAPLMSLFGLTPAEARLASTLAGGLDPARAAQEIGVSRVTARNQLRTIFAKTGTHRQSELVALLSRI
jgi:DNA-binding CsgD family transcriptional regulator